MKTEGFTPQVEWEPFVLNGVAGFRCTRTSDGAVTYIYLNPSTQGEGEPDVFVCEGPTPDPAHGGTLHYYTPEFRA